MLKIGSNRFLKQEDMWLSEPKQLFNQSRLQLGGELQTRLDPAQDLMKQPTSWPSRNKQELRRAG